MSFVLPTSGQHRGFLRYPSREHMQQQGLLAWWPLPTLDIRSGGLASPTFLNAASAGINANPSGSYWAMDGGTGTGLSRIGTAVYDPVIGPCMYFGGTQDWLRTAQGSLDLTVFTLAAWVSPHFTNGTGARAYCKILIHPTSDSAVTDPYSFYAIGVNNTSPAKFFAEISTGVVGSNVGVAGTTSIAAGGRYHVAATYNGTTLRIYVNGVEENSTAPAITVGSGATRTYIGTHFNSIFGAEYWLGFIGDTRIYNRVLSASEIANLYDPATRWALYSGAESLDPLAVMIPPPPGPGSSGAHRFFFA